LKAARAFVRKSSGGHLHDAPNHTMLVIRG